MGYTFFLRHQVQCLRRWSTTSFMGVFRCFCKGLFSVGLYIFCHLILTSRVLSCNPMAFISIVIDLQEEFEDTKGVIRIRKSKHHFHHVGICLFVTYNWNIFLYNSCRRATSELSQLHDLFLSFFSGFCSIVLCRLLNAVIPENKRASLYQSWPARGPTQSVHAKLCIGRQRCQILNFQNTFDSPCDEIRLEIQSRKYLRKSNLNEINKTLCSTKYIQIKFKEFVVFGNL